jgi:protein TonB
MKKIILFILTFISICVFGQPEVEKEDIYTVVEEMPDFPGGITERNKFIIKNLRFPDSAIKKQIIGKCFLKFTISKDGTVKDIVILKGVENCPECDEEAKRVIAMMPKWKHGKQNGNPVSVYYNLPINFQYK